MPDKINKYVDPTGEFSNKELRWGEWYLRHKIVLGKIGTGLLITWCVLTIGYSLIAWGYYLIIGYRQDRALLVRQTLTFPNYQALQSRYRALDLEIGGIQVFRSGLDRYDLVADVNNPNERWVARLRYHFVAGSDVTPPKETVIMPGSSRPVISFGFRSASYPAGAELVVDEIGWQRLNPHRLPEVAGYQAERLQFVAEDFAFRTAESGSGLAVPRLTFMVHNRSAYSYWQPDFYVDLLNGFQRVGVLFLSLNKFRAGEKRSIDLRYFGDQVTVTEIRLHPIVDIYDERVYLAPPDS